jgi:hypothetical protein
MNQPISLEVELNAYQQACKLAMARGAPCPRPHGRLKLAVASVNRKNKRAALTMMKRFTYGDPMERLGLLK